MHLRLNRLIGLTLFVLLFGAVYKPIPALAQTTGINVPNVMRVGKPQRDALIAELKAAGVHEVRFSLAPQDQDIEFAKQLFSEGIRIDLIVFPQWPRSAPLRPYNPAAFPSMWSGQPLSDADPTLSKAYYQALFNKLDENGVVLAGIELGNEINWSAFNADFPLPGEGKIFGLDDLSSDPEGQKIAAGYLRYLKILAVLKEVRNASTLNKNVPIILAGLSNTGQARVLPGGRREDGVTIDATIEFMRQHGLDNLVDAYGVHYYPENKTAERRLENLEDAVAQCEPAGSGAGKPCWITEWGIQNRDLACPVDEASRLALIDELKTNFEALAAQGRVVNTIYYAWTTWAKTVDPYSVFRCGALTEAGKAALEP